MLSVLDGWKYRCVTLIISIRLTISRRRCTSACNWFIDNGFLTTDKFYILGPCSAESREQVLDTARAIQSSCGASPLIYRAGAWKPRTNPASFQGVGEIALEWLAEVKATLGIPVATEVATPEHIGKALAAGIDYLWIGARTSANPIAVQALAEALAGANLKGVFIKNPVNADADLWLGNIERLEATGLPVMAIHRGCNHKPCWAMAHKVRTARPDIPMLLDPSHLTGDAAKIPALMGKIEELGLDGAMVEVHCDPAHALSDNAQQITPSLLRDTLVSNPCRVRVESVFSTTDSSKELNWLRAEIDELDEQLWDTIAARMDVSRRIGEWKKANHVAPLQPERYQTIVERIKGLDIKGLEADFALKIWELIHEESLRQQK